MSREEIVMLKDEDGKDVEFIHLMTFDHADSFYVALTPQDEVDGISNGEVLLMEIREDEDGSDVYLPIESEESLSAVWKAFEQLYYEDDEDEE